MRNGEGLRKGEGGRGREEGEEGGRKGREEWGGGTISII